MLKQQVYILSLTVVLLLAGLNKAGAQQAATVLRGSVNTYSIPPAPAGSPYGYVWFVTGGTSSTLGTNYQTGNIVWDGAPGQYVLSVYMTNTLSICAGNIQSLFINVLPDMQWQTDTTAVCSSTASISQDFAIEINFPNNTSAWSFEYQVDNSTPIKITVKNETSKILNIKGFINGGATDDIHTVKITRITLPGGQQVKLDGTEKFANKLRHVVRVYPQPSAGKIEFVKDL